MSKQRRSFSPEFKQQAACLVLDQGYSFTEASRSVGVGESVLRRWVQQLQMERQGSRCRAKSSPRISNVSGNSRRVSNASSARRPF
ncbi:transposase [Burkholderia sp. Tr-20390]|nr:transposase [Burkholderia sp. Tr-20390]